MVSTGLKSIISFHFLILLGLFGLYRAWYLIRIVGWKWTLKVVFSTRLSFAYFEVLRISESPQAYLARNLCRIHLGIHMSYYFSSRYLDGLSSTVCFVCFEEAPGWFTATRSVSACQKDEESISDATDKIQLCKQTVNTRTWPRKPRMLPWMWERRENTEDLSDWVWGYPVNQTNFIEQNKSVELPSKQIIK